MANPAGPQVWVKRATFVIIAFVIMVVQLVPQSMEPRLLTIPFPNGLVAPLHIRMVPPDLCLLVTIVWVVRRPRLAPVRIVAAIFLTGDLIFQGPPGLWAGMVVLVSGIKKGVHHLGLRALRFLKLKCMDLVPPLISMSTEACLMRC